MPSDTTAHDYYTAAFTQLKKARMYSARSCAARDKLMSEHWQLKFLEAIVMAIGLREAARRRRQA